MSNSTSELQKSKKLSAVRVRRRVEAGKRSCGVNENQLHHPVIQARPRSNGGAVVQRARRVSEVYDLMNAGEQHRFVVMGSDLLIVHNCVQATARDCLKESMLALNDAGFDIRAHVHDEVIITEPVNGRSVEDVCAVMGRSLPWAEGLPLRGDGYECNYYMKD